MMFSSEIKKHKCFFKRFGGLFDGSISKQRLMKIRDPNPWDLVGDARKTEIARSGHNREGSRCSCSMFWKASLDNFC